MGQISPAIPAIDELNSTADPKIRNALITIRNEINGRLNSDNWEPGSIQAINFSDDLAKLLGIDNGSVDGRGYAAVATSQTTSSTSFADLATVGPQVTVNVPANGIVAVYAEATINPGSGGAALVGLHEPTDQPSAIPILNGLNADGTKTRATVPGSIDGVDKATARGAFLHVPATAGARTYTLKYARVGGSGNVTYSNRKLWVIACGA